MTGIVGILSKNYKADNLDNIGLMVDTMNYEPFYSAGSLVFEDLNVFTGWCCHKGSFCDCMPVVNENKDLFLLFAGELYQKSDFETRLKNLGHDFSSGDASSLVHAYEEEGDEFLKKLNGWFSGFIVDKRKNRFVLFNDRYGLNRIYYYENRDAFYFASEAKSILKTNEICRQIDSQGLGEFFSCGYVQQNRSLFNEINLLPTGSKWVFDQNFQIKKKKYFDFKCFETINPILESEYVGKLKNTLTEILPLYFQDKRKKAVSLTGGLDGRIIMALSNMEDGKFPCYTFGGPYRDCADEKIAKQVAKLCKQPHVTIKVGDDFLSKFSELAQKTVFISDGCMDVTGAVELYVNMLARSVAPVKLNGNYGTEIVRNFGIIKPGSIDINLFDFDFKKHLKNAIKTFYIERNEKDLSFIAFKQIPWFHYSRFSIERSQVIPRSPYLDNKLVNLMYSIPENCIKDNYPSMKLILEANSKLAGIPTDRGFSINENKMKNFLRRKLVNFTIKSEYLYNYGMPQWLVGIDKFLTPLHPEKIFLGRHKFYHFRIWYRDKFPNFLKNVLLDRNAINRSYIQKNKIEKIIVEHIKGRKNYTSEISKMLTLELIKKKLLELK